MKLLIKLILLFFVLNIVFFLGAKYGNDTQKTKDIDMFIKQMQHVEKGTGFPVLAYWKDYLDDGKIDLTKQEKNAIKFIWSREALNETNYYSIMHDYFTRHLTCVGKSDSGDIEWE